MHPFKILNNRNEWTWAGFHMHHLFNRVERNHFNNAIHSVRYSFSHAQWETSVNSKAYEWCRWNFVNTDMMRYIKASAFQHHNIAFFIAHNIFLSRYFIFMKWSMQMGVKSGIIKSKKSERTTWQSRGKWSVFLCKGIESSLFCAIGLELDSSSHEMKSWAGGFLCIPSATTFI